MSLRDHITELQRIAVAEEDWIQLERRIKRESDADEPDACPHYLYPVGLEEIVYGIDGLPRCKRCRKLF